MATGPRCFWRLRIHFPLDSPLTALVVASVSFTLAMLALGVFRRFGFSLRDIRPGTVVLSEPHYLAIEN